MKKFILLLATVGLITACSNDDDTPAQNTLSGTWHLIDVTCECKPVDFKVGEHVWNFNLKNNQVTVVNTPSENLQILDNGNYTFSIQGETITIQSVVYDYYFKAGYLFLSDNPEVDGPLMKFTRN